MNVYYCGCSLAEGMVGVGSGGGPDTLQIPAATFRRHSLCPLRRRRVLWLGVAPARFVESPVEVEVLKGASRPFAGREQRGVPANSQSQSQHLGRRDRVWATGYVGNRTLRAPRRFRGSLAVGGGRAGPLLRGETLRQLQGAPCEKR